MQDERVDSAESTPEDFWNFPLVLPKDGKYRIDRVAANMPDVEHSDDEKADSEDESDDLKLDRAKDPLYDEDEDELDRKFASRLHSMCFAPSVDDSRDSSQSCPLDDQTQCWHVQVASLLSAIDASK